MIGIKEEVKKDHRGEQLLNKCTVKLMDLGVQVEVVEIKGSYKTLHMNQMKEEELDQQDKI